jgi:hypothetical protein
MWKTLWILEVFESVPALYLVLKPDLTMVAVSNAYPPRHHDQP